MQTPKDFEKMVAQDIKQKVYTQITRDYPISQKQRSIIPTFRLDLMATKELSSKDRETTVLNKAL